jgi:hypothetical protein
MAALRIGRYRSVPGSRHYVRVSHSASGARVWRVRLWIRLVAVVAWGLLALQQTDTIRRAGRGEVPQTEVRDGFVVLSVLAVLVIVLAFRPAVRLSNGEVRIRNPLRTIRFAATDVVEIKPTSYGVAFYLSNGSSPWSIVFQDTHAFGEPRWFDVAEAVTGHRPQLLQPWQDEDDQD